MSFNDYFEYVPVAERKAKAQKCLEKLRKKNPNVNPVVINGRKLTTTWWGTSWNHNLESYSDYANRMGRGRSYVRHGAVLDLQITPGKVLALVQGSAKKPYEICVDIKPLSKSTWEAITTACEGKIDSLQELLEGKFPKGLAELFTNQGKGLFPSPNEISLKCSCPDWAVMCKHVAAVLYGVGARLDENPALFFLLRDINIDQLISRIVTEKSDALIKKSTKRSARVIDDDNVAALFGIDMDEVLPAAKSEEVEIKKKPGRPRSSGAKSGK